MKKTLLLFVTLLFLVNLNSFSQVKDTTNLGEKVTNLEGSVEGLNESLAALIPIVDALKKIKISGYIQTQFQVADVDGGVAGFAGGNFPTYSHSRLMIRRGRIKFNYDNDLTQSVLQFDVTEKGLAVKDAYVSIKEPWMKAISLTAGIFDRPFGFEISYSSSNRESPERSRLFQTLFPGERDLGAKLEIAPQSGPLSFLNLKLGVFNGNGPVASGNGSAFQGNLETDNYKDIIGRLGFSIPIHSANVAIDGGVSGYFGTVRLDDGKKAYTVNSPSTFTVDSVTRAYDRTYIGADLQVYFDFLSSIPFLGGSSLRGEFISGKQPGNSGGNGFYKVGSGDLYLRNFNGYYVNFIQNLGEKVQVIVKYDVLNPNSDIVSSDIGALNSANKVVNANLGLADLKYTTLGLGMLYHWDHNVKFTFYYEAVSNGLVNPSATGSFVPYKEDIRDNVFTLRIQYKF